VTENEFEIFGQTLINSIEHFVEGSEKRPYINFDPERFTDPLEAALYFVDLLPFFNPAVSEQVAKFIFDKTHADAADGKYAPLSLTYREAKEFYACKTLREWELKPLNLRRRKTALEAGIDSLLSPNVNVEEKNRMAALLKENIRELMKLLGVKDEE
jgi:hypothetical protein